MSDYDLVVDKTEMADGVEKRKNKNSIEFHYLFRSSVFKAGSKNSIGALSYFVTLVHTYDTHTYARAHTHIVPMYRYIDYIIKNYNKIQYCIVNNV